jgi:flagellar basal-body rod modification protein FlgD
MTVDSILSKAASAASTSSSSSSTSSSASTSTSTDSLSGANSTLTQADFLKLLVAQIQYQDPMNPQSDTEMAAQMAQFSSLSASTASASSLAMMQAKGLVGSTVGLQVDSTTTTSGVVSGVVMSNGTPEITVGSTNYTLSQVTSVTPASTSSSSSSSSSAAGSTPSSSSN